MNADGAGHLRETRDGFLDVAGVDHHQVGQFVDDDDDVGQRLVLGGVGVVKERERLALLECAVVLVDVADAARGQQFQARFHLARGIAQNVGRDFRDR